MESPILKQIAKFLQDKKRYKRWLAVVVCLAVVVGFATTAALKMRGKAMTHDERMLNCKLQVHQHTDACYDQEKNIICGYADYVVHKHNDDCYDPNSGNLVCTLPEVEAHQHTEECYQVTETLGCGLEESEGHKHTEECYTREQGELACQVEEHTHTEECQGEDGTFTCGKEEHTHTDECYEWNETLTCGQEESEGHKHTAECYQEQRTLVCQKPEVEVHIHGDGCYERVLITPEGEEIVQDPKDNAGIAEKVLAGTANEEVPEGRIEVRRICGKLQVEEHTHTQESGCIEIHEVIDGTDLKPVEEVDANADGTPEEGSQKSAQTPLDGPEASGSKQKGITKTFENKDFIVTATYSEKANIPDEAELLVEQVTAESDEKYFAEREAEYRKELGDETATMSAFFKIGFYVEGKEIEPEDAVSVTIQFMDENGLPEGIPIKVMHFMEEGTETLDGGEAENGSISFETESFSGYAVGYTLQDGQKAPKNNNVTTVESASTSDFLEINLFDYETNINTLYKQDKKYPGFQQDSGTIESINLDGVYGTSYNFGDNIVSDLRANPQSITGKGGDINKTVDLGKGTASSALYGTNSPMSKVLGTDGYPQLSDNTSLSYLFKNGTYAKKKNTEKLDGLFRYDSTTGEYEFDSRKNHAEFDAEKNSFVLYNALLSPNYMMYPFGNFMPFNKINTETTLASTIDRDYFSNTAAYASYKANNNDLGFKNDYNTLATRLREFVSKMDKRYPNGWRGKDALDSYFKAVSSRANIIGSKDDAWVNQAMNKVYSIDYDEVKNFFFGMSIEMNYMQPKDGMTGLNGNYPMKFEFAGDDDVWVYVDGVLLLELSGIHRHVAGTIDFVDGTVTYYPFQSYAEGELGAITGKATNNVEKTYTFEEILTNALGSEKAHELLKYDSEKKKYTTFKDYSTHNFKFYYMERGAGSSVCRINFNFPLLPKNSISVLKELDMSEAPAAIGNPDFEFQVLKANGSTYTNELFIGAERTYKIFKDGKDTGKTGKTDSNGVFRLKANEMAVFEDIGADQGSYYVRELLDTSIFEQYGGTVVVDGNTSTKTEEGIEIGTDTFSGILSPIKKIDDGAVTSFSFVNKVKFDKLGSLEISKAMPSTDFQKLPAGKMFDFNVTLDGEPLKVGTAYEVYKDGRKLSDKEVTQEGIVTLGAGETVKIANILAGVQYTVEETSASSEGYIVIYEDVTDSDTDSTLITGPPVDASDSSGTEDGNNAFEDTDNAEEEADMEASGDDEESNNTGGLDNDIVEEESASDGDEAVDSAKKDIETDVEADDNSTDMQPVPRIAKNTDARNAVENITKITGTIKLNTAIKIKVTNTSGAAVVDFSGRKVLENADGKQHGYQFELVRVKDADGTPFADDEEPVYPNTPFKMESGVTLDGTNEQSFNFILQYQTADLAGLSAGAEAKFYYEVSEETDSLDTSTKYDDSKFIVEITVTKDTIGRLTAILTDVYKNGNSIKKQDTSGNNIFDICFTNELLTNLTVAKMADNKVSADTEFTFTVEINGQGNILESQYITKKKCPGQEEAEEGTIVLNKGEEEGTYFAEIKLKPGEYLTIMGLPYGVTWKATETNTDGYFVYYVVDSTPLGDLTGIMAKNGNLEELNKIVSTEGTVEADMAEGSSTDNTITFINMTIYKLPKTGGTGTTLYTMAGVLSILCGAGLMYRKKFRERRVGGSS